MKKIEKGSPNLIIAFDLETNGRRYHDDRILEIYAASYNASTEKICEFHRLIKIEENNVDVFIQLFRGWTNEYLNKKGVFPKSAVSDFVSFVRQQTNGLAITDYILVGYNAILFDNNFLKKYFKEYSLELPIDDITFDCYLEYKGDVLGVRTGEYRKDWRRLHKRMLNNDYAGKLKSAGIAGLTLSGACNANGIEFNEDASHNAKYDALKTLELLLCQRPEWFSKNSSKLLKRKVNQLIVNMKP